MIHCSKSFSFTFMILALAVAGCGVQGDVCQAASDHLGACLGEQAASTVQSCDTSRAEQVLAQDCDTLRGTLAGGKADGWWSELMCDMNYLSYCDPLGETAALAGLIGDWKAPDSYYDEEWKPNGDMGCPPAMRVIKHVDEYGVDIALRVLNKDGSTGGYVYDRADFVDINRGEDCRTTDVSDTEAIESCYETEVTRFSQLTQTTRTELKVGYKYKPITTETMTATQRLTHDLSVNYDQLTYTYEGPTLLHYDRCVYYRM